MDAPHRPGAVHHRLLDDGRELTVYAMLFNNGRLCVGDPTRNVYDDFWCFSSVGAAIAEAEQWDGSGEPGGWVRHPGSGRRRPEGDTRLEYVAS